MTTLEEEDELFGAHLSMGFDDDNQPWRSVRPWNKNKHTVYREPYELLDDVPPANISSQTMLIQPGYPADELPRVDGIGVEDGIDSLTDRPRVTFRLEKVASPYPIDDYSDVDVMSNYSNTSKMSYENTYTTHHDAHNISITESRSDSEMSTYQSMNDTDYTLRDEHRTSPGRNDLSISRYEFDNNSYDSEESESDSDSTSGGDKSRSSMSTFDRFYHDGDEGLTDSPGTHLSDRSAGMDTPEFADKDSRAMNSETLQNDSYLSSTLDRTSEENAKRREAKMDDCTLTPLPNARSQTNSGRQEDDIFRIHGADSFLSSKSGGISAGMSSSSNSDESSQNPSYRSDDSAVQHLADFDKHHKPNFLDSPTYVLGVEPHPTTHLINGVRRRVEPSGKTVYEIRDSDSNYAQELDRCNQFELFPDILRDYQPMNTSVYQNEKSLNDKRNLLYKGEGIEAYVHGFNEREPDGECYNNIKHKLERSDDILKEDEVGPGRYQKCDFVTDVSLKPCPREKQKLAADTAEPQNEKSFNGKQNLLGRRQGLEANVHGFSEREPDGECYNNIKHKLVRFEDVFEEDNVGKGRHQNYDFDFVTDVSISSSSSSSKHSSNEKQRLAADEISVISEDSDICHLAQQHALRKNEKSEDCMNATCAIKYKDSMESGIKIDFGGRNQIDKIKQRDSMQSYMNIDRQQTASSVVSPPHIRRKGFDFSNMTQSCSEDSTDDDSRSESTASEPVCFYDEDCDTSSDDAREEYSSEDESDSDDPSLFPSKAIFQMNLGRQHPKASDLHISGDLIEKACYLLSRGRNNDALDTLTIALHRAENNTNHAKTMMDDHYLPNKLGSKTLDINDEAFEDQLETNFLRAASEMADILNNIGVVHEMNNDLQKAMNSFRSSFTVYRDMCHRYENTGDSDVDRTVSNIMQMGIAMRSQQRRLELHSKVRQLETQIHSSEDPSTRMKLRMEMLHVLMCIIDVESESLGRNHPSVGFSLMKKGDLHQQMSHTDQAIKDCREAIEILKKGLGHIHPEVGRAMIRLAEIYWDSDKETALSLYQASLVPLRESFGSVNSEMASAYNSIGIIYAMKSDIKNAMKSFYDALIGYGVRIRADEETSSLPAPDIFFVWINVGDLHSEKNEWQLALRSFQKACTSFRALNDSQKDYLQHVGPQRMMKFAKAKLRKSFVDNETVLLSVLQNIGKAQCMLQKYGKSVETLQEALRIQKVIFMRCEKADVNSTRDVARALGNLGEVQMLSGDLTSSLESYILSLNILRSSGHVEESMEVALVLGAIGQLHLKKGCYIEAAVTLQQCMRIFERNGVPVNNDTMKKIRSFLVDAELALIQNMTTTLAGQEGRDKFNSRYDDRAIAIDEIADMYKNRGDHSGAIWFYIEALDLRREKAQQLSGAQKACENVDIARTICNIAQMRCHRREFEAAGILFDEAKHIYHAAGLPRDHQFYKDYLDLVNHMRKM